MTETINTTLVSSFKHADIFIVGDKPELAIVKATSSYIPIAEFKKIFFSIGELVKSNKITKLIFDKSNLNVFHQPSMEWYFTEWKEEMYNLGLKTHRKILPENEIFKQSVKIGRAKISAAYPNGKFHEMDIAYANSLEEAINN
ncbi:MAG TPA: hypothetical protein PKC24_09780 [Cyclobacteriaceae bacterium]|nr:hypothetical protein [Cyclobacteriaceae bacterium]